MQFDWKLSFGDLLTFVSVVLSAAGLMWTWHQDIGTRERQQTADVRKAAAATMAKLERVNQLVDLLFADLQPIVIETTDLLADKRDAGLVRDYFWKNVTAARLKHCQRFMDEQLEAAYVGLYSYMKDARAAFQHSLQNLQVAEEAALIATLQQCQAAILAYDLSRLQTYQPAELGNALRDIIAAQRDEYARKAEHGLADIQARLARIVEMRDADIIGGLDAKTL